MRSERSLLALTARTLSPLSLSLLLAGCPGGGGGSGGDNGDDNTTPPTVVTTDPAADATGVTRTTSVSAAFDEDIFALTVDTGSFTPTDGGKVSGTVDFDGASNVATFTPDRALSLLTPYTATLTTAITDLAGNALANEVSWSFTVADGSWGAPAMIEMQDNPPRSPQVAMNADGHAFACGSRAIACRVMSRSTSGPIVMCREAAGNLRYASKTTRRKAADRRSLSTARATPSRCGRTCRRATSGPTVTLSAAAGARLRSWMTAMVPPIRHRSP